jgi:hypothetical protein
VAAPWARHADARFSAGNLFDYALTALALGMDGYYGAIAGIQAIVSSYGYPRLVPRSLALLGFGVWDLVTYVHPIRSFETAALTHGIRLYMAWWMLIVEILIRHTQDVATGSSHAGEFAVTGAILAVLVGLIVYWERQLSGGRSTAPCSGGPKAADEAAHKA